MELLIERLRTRAQIRRQITTRKSVQNGEPDRIADLLEEAANTLEAQFQTIKKQQGDINKLYAKIDDLRGTIDCANGNWK